MVTCIHISGTNLTRGCRVSSLGNRKMKSQQKKESTFGQRRVLTVFTLFFGHLIIEIETLQ